MIPRLSNSAVTPAPAQPPLRPGAGVRMGRNSLGVWFETPSGGGDFRHPWMATAGGGRARVGKGYVIGEVAVEPMIEGVPISGDPKRPVPSLKLSESLVNKAKESWLCVDVTPDEDGRIGSSAAKVEVVQSTEPFVVKGKSGRAPIALLFLRAPGQWQVFQVAMFHMRYVTSKPAQGARNHFLL